VGHAQQFTGFCPTCLQNTIKKESKKDLSVLLAFNAKYVEFEPGVLVHHCA